jgi:hypothetical protein
MKQIASLALGFVGVMQGEIWNTNLAFNGDAEAGRA